MKIAVAFLCKYPAIETVNFAERISKLTTFDVFIISDEKYKGRNKIALYPNLEVICIEDDQCRSRGYVNSNISAKSTHIGKNPIAWDKMLYLFAEQETQYDFVWVFEDDVFIPSVDTLINLHTKYGDSYDLVTPNNFEKKDNIKDWHWKHIFSCIKAPYYYSMVCACGISRHMINAIKDYVKVKKQLFYIEAMFNTLAAHNSLRVADAFELKSVVWEGKWGLDEFILLPNNVFHPMKLLVNFEAYRHKISEAKAKNYIAVNNLPSFIVDSMYFSVSR